MNFKDTGKEKKKELGFFVKQNESILTYTGLFGSKPACLASKSSKRSIFTL